MKPCKSFHRWAPILSPCGAWGRNSGGFMVTGYRCCACGLVREAKR